MPSPAYDRIVAVRQEVSKVIVGQQGAIAAMVTALLVGGHVLLEGVPGTAKTLMVSSLAGALNMQTNRVQFTPDLMPSDILGQSVYQQDAPTLEEAFRFREGPIFTNILLADEINRTPPRTQAALLEAMEEGHVTVEGTPRNLPQPFLVIATQNPIEYEGTYPLPEAQLDRFVFKLPIDYPRKDEEIEVLARHAAGMNTHDVRASGINPVASVQDIMQAREEVKAVRVDPVILDYIVQLAQASRVSPSLSMGMSPRGSTWLLKSARAWAWLHARDFVTPDDVQAMATPVMRHRLAIRPDVALDGGSLDEVLKGVLQSVPVPR